MGKKITIDDLTKKLQGPHHKITPQRKVVLQVFIDNPGKHLSAEDVHYILRDKDYDIGLATVYRSLELLADINILQKNDFGDGCRRYELNTASPNAHQHHHLICVKCGKVNEFADDLLDDLEADIMKKSNFKITDHQVTFYGYCSECQKKL
ncbi:Fur family transcriptional regulator [Pectinatus frisingensis]|uniref:Fur family transcriptional regulator n=1 Tax=Pectinatus frisingensis TaxID=865 RepID=UPI0015F61A12|nr:transcriptional repressor [Pectinatus frisingensis]